MPPLNMQSIIEPPNPSVPLALPQIYSPSIMKNEVASKIGHPDEDLNWMMKRSQSTAVFGNQIKQQDVGLPMTNRFETMPVKPQFFTARQSLDSNVNN